MCIALLSYSSLALLLISHPPLNYYIIFALWIRHAPKRSMTWKGSMVAGMLPFISSIPPCNALKEKVEDGENNHKYRRDESFGTEAGSEGRHDHESVHETPPPEGEPPLDTIAQIILTSHHCTTRTFKYDSN